MGQALRVSNPATGQLINEVPIVDAAGVALAVQRARAAQREWVKIPIRERARRVLSMGDVLDRHRDEIISTIVRENGKPVEEVIFGELLAVQLLLRFYGKKGPKFLKPRKIPSWGPSVNRSTRIHYHPHGVVGVISPWNYPFQIPAYTIYAAFLAGNAVVLKPSEWTPNAALLLKRLHDESEFPNDLLQVVTGDGTTGSALIESGVEKISFTGSTAVGKKVAAACGARLVPCTLELGGKAAAIVLPDANIERAAHSLVWGSFFNSGQTCVGVERIYAHDDIYDALVGRMVELTRTLRQGDPSGEVDLGAMTFPRQVDVVERLVEDAKRGGAQVLIGGHRLADRAGLFYAPTILVNVNHSMAIMRDEVFGPVVCIQRVKTQDEALELANDSHLGLYGYVFGGNVGRARALAREVIAGTVMVNDTLACYAFAEIPFGGLKQSGVGQLHGAEGLWAMCQQVTVNAPRPLPWLRRELWWFPYKRGLGEFFKRHTRFIVRLLSFFS